MKPSKMYNIVYSGVDAKSNVLKSYRTKREAQQELDDRQGLCYMLRLQDHETYSIAKGKTNATIRNGFRKTRPMS
jgi:hypothetical protein